MLPTQANAESPTAPLPAHGAAARGSALWRARQTLAQTPSPPTPLLDTLIRVAVATRDEALFAEVRPLLPPVPAPAPHPPAHDAWSRGDACHAAGDRERAQFWWSAALRFGDGPGDDAERVLERLGDENEPATLRARAAMRLTVAAEARRQTFFFSAAATNMLDMILQWEPDYLPAQVLRAAQAYALHEPPQVDQLLSRLWPAAAALGLAPPTPPAAATGDAERLHALEAVAAWWPQPLLLQYACAVGQYEGGDRPAAERRARDLAHLEPAASAPHELLAQLCTHENRWPEARDAWRSGLLRDARRAEAWLGLAQTELVLGEPEAAENCLRRYADHSQSPSLAKHWLHVGYELALQPGLANGRAIEAFRAVLNEDDRTEEDEANALINLGVTLRFADRPHEASIALGLAQPLVPQALGNRTALDLPVARAAYEAGQVDVAIEAFDRYLAEHQDDQDAFWELLQALVDAGQLDRARAHLAQVAASAPRDPDTRHQLGRGYLSLGAFDEARLWLGPLQQEDPRVDVLLTLMHALEAGGEPDQAAAMAEWHVQQSRPLAPVVFERWARALMQRDRFDEAQTACERGLAHFADSASLLFHTAMVLGARGAMAASLPYVYEALRLEPDHVEALRLVASLPEDEDGPLTPLACLARLFELVPHDLTLAMKLALAASEDDAPALCLRACERAAQSPAFGALALHLKGCTLRSQGDWSGACEAFEDALEREPLESPIWQDLASTRAALEQWDESEACWRRAQALDPDDEDVEHGLALLAQHRRRDEAARSPSPAGSAWAGAPGEARG